MRVARAPLGAGTPVEETPAGSGDASRPPPLPWNAEVAARRRRRAALRRGRTRRSWDRRTAWFRLKVPVIAGEQPTPLQRLLVAADFPNGISNELDWNEWLFINPDLTVYIEREPRSEWVALQAHTRIVEGESALAQAALFDTEGRIGRSLQSLYVAPAPGRAG